METTAWSNGHGVFGIRVGTKNRERYFSRLDSIITVEIDGNLHEFTLTPGFWKKCPEIRDSGRKAIRNWLERHHTTDWPTGRPPRFSLHYLSRAHFRLST